MARHLSKEEKREITKKLFSRSLRDVAAEYGIAHDTARNAFYGQVYDFFLKSEVFDETGKRRNIDELRKIFNQYRPAEIGQKNIKKVNPEERIKRSIKALLQRKTPGEIAESFNSLGIKTTQGFIWTKGLIIEAVHG